MADSLPRILAALAGQSRHDPRERLVRLAAEVRARHACEYCLMPTGGQFQIDHIFPPMLWDRYTGGKLTGIAPQPGRRGPDHLDNYAWCCPFCNGRKGQRVAGRVGRRQARLFDPRNDHWPEHFILAGRALFIVGLTDVGRATEHILGFNDAVLGGPLAIRHLAILAGDYPPTWASGSSDPSHS
jgi:hypothetical protein